MDMDSCILAAMVVLRTTWASEFGSKVTLTGTRLLAQGGRNNPERQRLLAPLVVTLRPLPRPHPPPLHSQLPYAGFASPDSGIGGTGALVTGLKAEEMEVWS